MFEDFIKEYDQETQKSAITESKTSSKEYVSKDGSTFYVEKEGPLGPYVVLMKGKDGVPTEAWDDSFHNEKDAEEIAKKLASGELDEGVSINEADDEDGKSTDRGPIDNPDIEKALKNKAKETDCPIGIIRAVMRRGLAAWKSGHRPGAGQEQWGYARVNSFLTGGEGTWGKADADLAKEARKEGFNPKK